jgi:hypothetical protein
LTNKPPITTVLTIELPADLVMLASEYVDRNGWTLKMLIEDLLMQRLQVGRCGEFGILCYRDAPACKAYRARKVGSA